MTPARAAGPPASPPRRPGRSRGPAAVPVEDSDSDSPLIRRCAADWPWPIGRKPAASRRLSQATKASLGTPKPAVHTSARQPLVTEHAGPAGSVLMGTQTRRDLRLHFKSFLGMGGNSRRMSPALKPTPAHLGIAGPVPSRAYFVRTKDLGDGPRAAECQ